MKFTMQDNRQMVTRGYEDILSSFRSEHRLRSIPDDIAGGMVYLSSNDYMGLASRTDSFLDEFSRRSKGHHFSSSASRLLASDQQPYIDLENRLESLYGRPALLFNSGYHLNSGALAALSIPGTLIVSDKLIHASAIDGLRTAKDLLRFRHNDIQNLHTILQRHAADYDRVIVVAEAVYSMDGDLAPLEDMVGLKREFGNMMIYLDEAHSFGCLGNQGLGLAEDLGLMDEVDFICGTFGKAAASAGAFVVSSELFKDYLLNTARSFIFSTALPPSTVIWTSMMIEQLTSMQTQRQHLARLSQRLREAVEEITGSMNPSRSHIVPFITGDSQKAMAISSDLRRCGFNALPIRRPTVPAGGERIRFSLSAAMSDNDLDGLISNLKRMA